jgi:hypothetical protein
MQRCPACRDTVCACANHRARVNWRRIARAALCLAAEDSEVGALLVAASRAAGRLQGQAQPAGFVAGAPEDTYFFDFDQLD